MEKKELFLQRRQALFERMPAKSIAVLFASSEQLRNGDSHYPYRPHSDFYYLTGFVEPESIAVFIKQETSSEFILFCRPKNPELELWIGPITGPEMAVKDYGAQSAYPLRSFKEKLSELCLGHSHIFYLVAEQAQWDTCIVEIIQTGRKKNRRGVQSPEQYADLRTLLHELRLHKKADEVACLQQAADISVAAHERATLAIAPGKYEYQIQAELEYVFKNFGAEPGYSSIVASGHHACTLHHIDNRGQLKAGDLLLMDAGAEYDYYCADITRTIPIDGKFSAPQQALYELVLQTQLAIIQLIRPGLPFDQLQTTTCRLLSEGLLSLGILEGSLDKILEKQEYKKFYPHGVSHWLGLDVHDAGAYKIQDQWRPLAEGMVLTVEPGLYIRADDQSVDEKWRGIGIRIEDDILVTQHSAEVLTAALPKEVSELSR